MSEPQEPQSPEPQASEPLSRRGGRGASDAGTPATSGLAVVIARHPRAWLFSTLAVVFVLLGTGAVFAGAAVGQQRPSDAAAAASSSPKSPTPTVEPPRPVPASLAAPARFRTCSIAAMASDGRLGKFEGSVVNAKTGEVLFDRSAGVPGATASVMKTLTTSVGLTVLGPDYQFSTKVFAGTTPGSIVLVGGGDPTLSAGHGTVYAGAPTLSGLANQVNAAWSKANPGVPITSIVLDATMWDIADAWDPSWPASERTQGYQPLIVPLMVDGDRANPAKQDSPRSADPVQAAGVAFKTALGPSAAAAALSKGTGSTGNPLGEVKSQPLKVLIGQLLPVSDNTLAEMIARVSSKVAGGGGSAASLTGVYTKTLAGYGIKTPGLVIKDGSGESPQDGVPPIVVSQLMAKVLAGGQNLSIIYNALPVSGKTGTLAGRFTGANAVARGSVNAKTGWIIGAYTLGGIVHAADGTALAFAFYALGPVKGTAMAALDTVTTAAYKCGDNLSNN